MGSQNMPPLSPLHFPAIFPPHRSQGRSLDESFSRANCAEVHSWPHVAQYPSIRTWWGGLHTLGWGARKLWEDTFYADTFYAVEEKRRVVERQQWGLKSRLQLPTRPSYALHTPPLRNYARTHPKPGALLLRYGSLLGAWSCLPRDCGRLLCGSALQRPLGGHEWSCGWVSMRPRENHD